MNSAVSDATLIGIDWGTSSLRAYLLDGQGQVRDTLASDQGIMRIADKHFEGVFHQLIDPWLDCHSVPLIMSGMITSRNGWLETPYQSLPVAVSELARTLLPLKTQKGAIVHLISGVTGEHTGAPDVMRGEEAQIVGAIHAGMTNATFVMPGTHSKWVSVIDGNIAQFSTYMTGELYEALTQHTILGALVEQGEYDEQQFARGVRKGMQSGSRFLHDLFGARTLPLFGKIDQTSVADYLSGILIGAEISGATNGVVSDSPVVVVGRNDLSDRYKTALSIFGQTCERAPNDIAANGHFAIATSAGLI